MYTPHSRAGIPHEQLHYLVASLGRKAGVMLKEEALNGGHYIAG